MELQWPLILFTFFLSLCGGTLAMQGLLCCLGKGKKMQTPVLIVSLVELIIGGIAVFLHLQHWERIFNGFGHITSGITLEFIGVIVFFVCLVVYFLLMRRSEKGMPPIWMGVVSIIVGLGICVVTGLSYLMPSLPVWDTPLLPIFYICNAAFLGGVSCMIIAGATKCEDAYRWTSMIALFGALAQAIVLIIYAVYITNLGSSYTDVTYYFDPTMPDSAIKDTDAIMASLLTGSNALAYWLGVMVIGIIVPVVFTILALVQKGTDAKRMIWYGIISLVCCVVGSIIWRCLLYVLATYVLPFF